jgi:hypothetical protein
MNLDNMPAKKKTQNNKFEILLERVVKAMEEQSFNTKGLYEVAGGLRDNIKILNDNFVLHNTSQECMGKDIKDVKEVAFKWLKYLAIALFITVGGLSVLKAISSGGVENLLK